MEDDGYHIVTCVFEISCRGRIVSINCSSSVASSLLWHILFHILYVCYCTEHSLQHQLAYHQFCTLYTVNKLLNLQLIKSLLRATNWSPPPSHQEPPGSNACSPDPWTSPPPSRRLSQQSQTQHWLPLLVSDVQSLHAGDTASATRSSSRSRTEDSSMTSPSPSPYLSRVGTRSRPPPNSYKEPMFEYHSDDLL
jgi:hypothetical protein